MPELKRLQQACYYKYAQSDFSGVFFLRPKEKQYQAPEYLVCYASAIIIEPPSARPIISLEPES